LFKELWPLLKEQCPLFVESWTKTKNIGHFLTAFGQNPGKIEQNSFPGAFHPNPFTTTVNALSY
jgi:hypothetical protein